MIRFLILPISFLLLAGCATAIDNTTQLVSIETPGAEGGLCFIERPGYRQRVWVPRRVHIQKTEDPVELTCIAPGNRIVKKTVKPEINNKTLLNIGTAGLGALVDYETGAMFQLPDTISVDFTNVAYAKIDTPDYDKLLKEHPELAGLEEFRPGQAMLLRDRYTTTPGLTARRSDKQLFSDQGLTELRAPDETVYIRPEMVGKGAESAGDDVGAPGGEPVIGGGAADDIGTALPPDIEPLTK